MRQDLVIIEPAPGPYEPTRDDRIKVAKAVACGLDEIEIAFMMQLDPLVVRRTFAQELRHGTAYFIAEVGSAMIDSAMRGDVNAQRNFLAMRGRWAPPTKAEADNDDLNANVNERRRLMSAIIDMVTVPADEEKVGVKPKSGTGTK